MDAFPYHFSHRTRAVNEIAQNVQAMITHQYQGGNDGDHKRIPREKERIGRYVPRRYLRAMSYPCPKLVQIACDSFRLASRRRHRQDRARRNMHRMMIDWATLPEGENPSGFSDANISRRFYRYADTYFFMNTLFGWPEDGGRPPLLLLGTRVNNAWRNLQPPVLSHTTIRERGKLISNVNSPAHWGLELELRAFFPIFTTILHELCHAYLMAFSCCCRGRDGCAGKIPRWHGFSYHGMCWLTLFGMVVREVRGWDPRLARFGIGVDHYYVSAGDLTKETEEYDAMFSDPVQRAQFLDVKMMDDREYTYGTYEENGSVRVFERRPVPVQFNQPIQPNQPNDPNAPQLIQRRKRRRQVDILREEAERFVGEGLPAKRRRTRQ